MGWFLIGLMLGGSCGLLIFALMYTARPSDDERF